MEKIKIFFIVDDPWFGEILARQLSLNPDYGIERFVGGECLQHLAPAPGLMILDYSLPGMDSPGLFHEVRSRMADLPVIIISDPGDAVPAIALLKEGASGYFVKNELTATLLSHAVAAICQQRSLEWELSLLRETSGHAYLGDLSPTGGEKLLRAYTVQIIRSFLQKYDHNVVKVACKLGVGKSTIYKMIETGEIERSPRSGNERIKSV